MAAAVKSATLRSLFTRIRTFSTAAAASASTATSKPSSKETARLFRYSYIVAPDNLHPGMKIMNRSNSLTGWNQGLIDPLSQVGNSMPLSSMRIGTFVHCVEHRPGEGAKYVRSAGTSAKIMKLGEDGQCVLKMPSGREKIFDSKCQATIGRVSNPERKHRKLRKAGQSRWLGRRPVVRGVAMNPVDHPHGGGEGRTSGGRPSVSPWGKPTKGGYKTVLKKNHDDRAVTKKGGRRG